MLSDIKEGRISVKIILSGLVFKYVCLVNGVDSMEYSKIVKSTIKYEVDNYKMNNNIHYVHIGDLYHVL